MIMMELARLTTEYVDAEDRVRLTGASAQGQTQVMWLTHRLLDRLLPHLFAWLERRFGALPHADVLAEFEQQRALQAITHQSPVIAAQTQCYLVDAIDVTGQDEQLSLVFKCADAWAARLSLQPTSLHQWLSIVEQAYQRAGWSMSVWPSWMHVASARPSHAPVILH